MSNHPTLIGIDGGATKVNAWQIQKDQAGFKLGNSNVQKTYSHFSHFDFGFTPVDIKTQLKEMKSTIHQTDSEIKQEKVIVESFSEAISEVEKNNPLIIGIGMPGLKTPDLRGIAAMANGPRMPNFCTNLEKNLEINKVQLSAPILRLGSDADYCGLGEEYASNGLFKNVQHAYYLGGGTGVADALKLNGKLIRFDNAKSWLLKSWEMTNNENVTLEKFASAGGIQSIYSHYSRKSISTINQGNIFPNNILDLADKKDEAAMETFSNVSFYLAELLFERIETIYSGWKGRFGFVSPNRDTPSSQHPFMGTTLERIVIGQRLGTLLESSEGLGIFWEPLVYHLTQLINESNYLNSEAKSHYLKNNKLNPELIQISTLRDAPALGAGIDAVLLSHD